jgi:Immunity protein 53
MSSTEAVLARIQEWYRSQCNGDWEHSYGVKIETLDNPGWLVSIDLTDTEWEHTLRPRKFVERSDIDWVQSEVTDRKFVGCGGVGNLCEVLELFLAIVSESKTDTRPDEVPQ